jgi:tetratricopeptide (TPR) repeat protein
VLSYTVCKINQLGIKMDYRLQLKALVIATTFFVSTIAHSATEQSTDISITDQVNVGRQAFNHGQYEDALAEWNIAFDHYRSTKNKTGQARILQYKAEAYLAIGQNYKATSNLESALRLAESSGDEQLAAQITGSLGTAFMLSNRTDEARDLLEKAVDGERTNGRHGSAAVAGNNLGNLLASQGDYESAISIYKQAISDSQKAGNTELAVKSSTNIARALIDSGREKEALESLTQTTKQAESLPPSHEKAYVLISIGRLYTRIKPSPENSSADLDKLASHAFNTAAKTADEISDNRALSYSYGYLGELDEQAGRTEDAIIATKKALHHLRTTPSPEIRYRWQWQEGRLLRAEGKTDLAINAFKRAVDDLQKIRPVLSTGNVSKSSNFREESGQLYLDLADQLLKKAS